MKLGIILLTLVGFISCNNQHTSTEKGAETVLKKEVADDDDSIRKIDTPKTRLISGVEVYEEGEENYLQEIKMDKKVIEALVTDSRVLYVTVKDDGTSQNNYAEYLCGIVSEFKANIQKIKVVKAVSSPINTKPEKDYGVLLGEANCK